MAAYHPSKGERGAGYARVSRDLQKTIPEQEAWIRQAVRAVGATLARSFRDRGVSGDEIDDRPDLQRLLEYVEAEWRRGAPVTFLVVWDPDRLSRADSLKTAAVLCRLRDAGCTRVLWHGGWIDLNDPTDRLVFGIQQEAQRSAFSPGMAKNVLRSMATDAAAGLWMGGKPPRGYRVVDGRLAKGEDAEVALIEWLFERYDTTDATLGSLMRDLERRGAKPMRAKRWSRRAVHAILTNRVYMGELVWGRVQQGRFVQLVGAALVGARPGPSSRAEQGRTKRRKHPRCVKAPDSAVVRVAAPSLRIVDPERFTRVQGKLMSNRTATGPRREVPWPLQRLIFCGACGQVCYLRDEPCRGGGAGGAASRRVVCPLVHVHGPTGCKGGGRAGYEEVEIEVVRILQQHLSHPSAVAAVRQAALADAAERAALLSAQRAALAAKLDAAEADVALASRRILTLPDALQGQLQAALVSLTSERDALVAELDDVDQQAAAAAAAVDPERLDKLLGLIGRLAELHALADPAVLRDAFRSLIARVDVTFQQRPQSREGTGKRLRFGAPLLAVTLSPEFAALFTSPGGNEQGGAIVFRSDGR